MVLCLRLIHCSYHTFSRSVPGVLDGPVTGQFITRLLVERILLISILVSRSSQDVECLIEAN